MSAPPTRRWLPVFVAVLAGLSLGLGVVRVTERMALDAGPGGWTRLTPNIPVLLARLAGPPNTSDQGWPLASHALLTAPGTRVQVVEAEAYLPENGHLEVVLEGSGGKDGVALKVDRGRSPYAMVTTAAGPSLDASHPTSDWAPLHCSGDLPAPTHPDVRARLVREAGGMQATLAVGDQPPVVVDCTWGRPTSGASIRSGLRRIGLRSLAVGQMNAPEVRVTAARPSWMGRVVGGLGAALVFGLLAGFARFGAPGKVRGAPIVLTTLPLWLVWPLSGADLAAALQAVRVVVDEPLSVAVVVPVLMSVWMLALMAMWWTARRVRSWTRPLRMGSGALLGLAAIPAYGPVGAVAVLPAAGAGEGLSWLAKKLGAKGPGPVPAMLVGALVAGVCTALLSPKFGMATTYASTVGMVVGGLVWTNVRRPRGFNAISLGLMVLAVFLADQSIRWTETGARLTGRSSRARTSPADDSKDTVRGTFSSFEALENTRTWSDYPFQDYPVEPSVRRAGAVRVVALGGSSTGGAWQNDNLDQFWPAELERRHGPSIQAVNQGVGGWTTLHIRRFLETRLADVDPDVVVLYIGHNDIITESVRPYGALFEAWKQGTDLSVSVSGALSNVPLYQFLRFGLQSAFGSAVQPAVPVRDARANIEGMVRLLAPRKVPLMLAREGVAPDPSVLDPYGEMLDAVAQQDDQVGFVDTSATLTGPGAGEVFLDNCHLTERGHARVAETVRAALLDKGWIPPAH